MNLPCTKCSSAATAVMSFDYQAAAIWLDDFTGPIEPLTGYAMCEAHASRTIAPVGWILTDRRGPGGSLFAVDVA